MRKFISIISAIVLFSVSAHAGNVEREFKMTGYYGIRASHQFSILVKKGTSQIIKVSCPEELETCLDIKQDKETLILSFNKSFTEKLSHMFDSNKKGKDNQVQVELEMPELNSVDLSGSCSLKTEGNFRTGAFVFDISGACDAVVNVDAMKLRGDVSGAAEFTASGHFDIVTCKASGSSHLTINSKCSNMNIELSGSSVCRYTGDVDDTVTINASGSTDSYFAGSATMVLIQASGTAMVDAKGLDAPEAEVKASGVSKVYVYANRKISMHANMTSRITYYGKPENIIADNGGKRYVPGK